MSVYYFRAPLLYQVLIFLVTAMIRLLILPRVTSSIESHSRYGLHVSVLKYSNKLKLNGMLLVSLNFFLLWPSCIHQRFSSLVYPFQAQQDISSLKNIAGETGKKLSSFASTFINDLQDRILWNWRVLCLRISKFATLPINICVV